MSREFSWSLNLRTCPYCEFPPHRLVAFRAQQLLSKARFEIEVLLRVGLSVGMRNGLGDRPLVLPLIQTGMVLQWNLVSLV